SCPQRRRRSQRSAISASFSLQPSWLVLIWRACQTSWMRAWRRAWLPVWPPAWEQRPALRPRVVRASRRRRASLQPSLLPRLWPERLRARVQPEPEQRVRGPFPSSFLKPLEVLLQQRARGPLPRRRALRQPWRVFWLAAAAVAAAAARAA